MKLNFVFIAVLSCFQFLHCYKVLLMACIPSPSHYFLLNTLAKGLVNAGHDVLIISPYTEEKPPEHGGTYREIVVNEVVEVTEGIRNSFTETQHINIFTMILLKAKLGILFTELTLKQPKLQQLLASDEHFDVVVVDQFLNDALKAFAYHYKCPLIMFSTVVPNNWVNPLVGNPSPSSYIPEAMLSYGTKMSFMERAANFIFKSCEDLHRHYIFLPSQNELMKTYFPDAPDLEVLYYNTSIVLVNSHESVNQAVPLVPNMIPIGGFHISPPKNLSMDLQQYLNNARDGVIYFSMGTNILPSKLRNKTIASFIEVFRKMKTKVLWKWDEEMLWSKPKNVMISKWFPQNDILAHPNVKLFITQGGILSLTESVYHGVPILVLPMFGDQFSNALTAEEAEIGLKILFDDITEERLTETIHEILHNPKYRQNIKRRSLLLHDRPVKPMELAIYWIEYVARNKGADHLKVAGLDLPWYTYLSLDVIGLLLFIVSLASYSLITCLRILVNYLRLNFENKLKHN